LLAGWGRTRSVASVGSCSLKLRNAFRIGHPVRDRKASAERAPLEARTCHGRVLTPSWPVGDRLSPRPAPALADAAQTAADLLLLAAARETHPCNALTGLEI
jgi:hypothetical protein